MNKHQQATELARKLARMTPLERTVAANDPTNGPTAVRILALTMVDAV